MKRKTLKSLISNKIFERIKIPVLFLLQTGFLASLALLSVFPVACRITPEGLELFGADYKPPVLEDFNVVSENQLDLDFSDKIIIKALSINKTNMPHSMESTKDELSESIKAVTNKENAITAHINYNDENTSASFIFDNGLEIGQQYSLYAQAEDRRGSTLTFAFNFLGFNDHIPKMIFTEVRPKYVKKAATKTQPVTFKEEFVELLVLSDGNTSGLEIQSAYDGESKKYIFPAVEVKKGEILIIHLRSPQDDTESIMKSELNEDLNESRSFYSRVNARDLWDSNTTSRLGDKTDVIVLKNNLNDSILDCILYADDFESPWNEKMEPLLSSLTENGFIPESSKEYAADGSSLTDTKSIIRLNAASILKNSENEDFIYPVSFDPNHWEVTKASGETPGIL